jgi:hypothetical protein
LKLNLSNQIVLLSRSAALVLFLISHITAAQVVIKGVVSESNGSALSYVRVVLKDSTATNILSYGYTDADGRYRVSTDSYGELMLEFSSIGFSDSIISLNTKSSATINLDLKLKLKSFVLTEVIVAVEKPITVKKDTIIFDASSFAEGNEEVVEDLLKKIPGLTIDEDGTIRVGAKEVERVMIEGDDFFEKGYKIITKNMPAQPIDKVELLQNYSSNPLLQGIEESDKVALNLKLNEDAKSQWFATVNASYGLENLYNFTSNIFNFSKRNKYYFITNFNNIGYESTGEINHLVDPYRPDDLTVIGENESVAELIEPNAIDLDFKKSRTDFNNDKLVSTNAIFNPTDRLKVKTIGFFMNDQKRFLQNISEQFRVDETEFLNSQGNNWNDDYLSVFGRINLQYDIKKNQKFEMNSTINSANGNTINELSFNNTETKENLNTKNRRFDNQISLITKMKDNKVFIVKGRYIQETRFEDYRVNQFFFIDLFTEDASADQVNQVNAIDFKYGAIEGHYLDRKKNKDLFEVKIGNALKSQNLNSTFSVLTNDSNEIAKPADFQNDFIYFTNDSYVSTKYSKNLGNVTLIGKAEYKFLFNQTNSKEVEESQNVHIVNPSIGLRWQPNDKHQLVANYSYSTSNAGFLDVYDSWVLRGFRSFTRGTGDFNQLNASTGLLNYQYGGWTDNFLISTTIFYSKSFDFFSYRSLLSQNYSLSQKALFSNRELLSVSSNVDRYIPFISSNLKLSWNYSLTSYQNIVNDVFREIRSRSSTVGVELRSAFSGPFNYHLGSKILAHKVQTNNSSSYSNNMTFLDILFKVNQKSTIQIQTERYFFGNIGADNDYYFLDVDWRFTIKPNKLTVSISGKNLLNTSQFKTASITDVSFLITEYNLLPRFVLISADYRF